MNLDDPKLTAFALGEMSDQEKADWETLLKQEKDGLAEIQETREMARILRDELKAEPAEGLHPHQRDAIFRAAQIAAGRNVSASERPAPVVIQASWWDRPGPWQAIAACAVIGFGIYAASVNMSRPDRAGQVADAPEMRITLPNDGIAQQDGATSPNLQTPAGREPAASRVAVSPSAVRSQNGATPVIQGTKPVVDLSSHQGIASASQNGNPDAGDTKVPVSIGSHGPKAIGPGNPQLVGASIGRPENNPGLVTDEMVALALRARLKDAAGLQQGSTFAEFNKVFEPDPKVTGRYQMRRSPSIKVDVTFESGLSAPQADTRIQQMSKPYLE